MGLTWFQWHLLLNRASIGAIRQIDLITMEALNATAMNIMAENRVTIFFTEMA